MTGLARRARRVVPAVALSIAASAATLASRQGDDLLVRVGLTADEAAKARAGQAAVRVLPPNAPTEIAVAGAIRIRGDLERLVVWLRDIEDFRKAAGTSNVGVIARPARPDDFASMTTAGLDVELLRKCRPGSCDIRMPTAYLDRISREEPWKTPQAATADDTLERALLEE